MTLYLGIDVGSASARAGPFDAAGALRGVGRAGFETRRDGPRVAWCSAGIQDAVDAAVRAALTEAGAVRADMRGIGVDAACSMVIPEACDAPVKIGPARRSTIFAI